MFVRILFTLPAVILLTATAAGAQDPPPPAAAEEPHAPLQAPGGSVPPSETTPTPPVAPATPVAPRELPPGSNSAPSSDCPCRDQSRNVEPHANFTSQLPAAAYAPRSLPHAPMPPSGTGWAPGAGGLHPRYPYYSYRRPWYYRGPASQNVTIPW